jgi:hypothetical protein
MCMILTGVNEFYSYLISITTLRIICMIMFMVGCLLYFLQYVGLSEQILTPFVVPRGKKCGLNFE